MTTKRNLKTMNHDLHTGRPERGTIAFPDGADFAPEMTPAQVGAYSTLALAHIGDGVYELMMRTALCAAGLTAVTDLHRETVRRVNAPAQARVAEAIQPALTDEERAESLRARNRAIAALGLGSLVMAGKEGSSTLREVAFSLELGHPVLLWHSIVEEGEPWAIRLLENPPLDSQGRPLVQTVSSAADVEEALSPWSTVWWL